MNTPMLTFLQMLKCLAVNILQGTSLPVLPRKEQELYIDERQDQPLQSIPKIIWMYWEDQALPRSIVAIVEHIKKLHPAHEIHMLHRGSFSTFLPGLIFKGEMPIANKTDIIRLELLYRYGGIWLDCTTILGDSLAWVHDVAEQKSVDIVGYYREKSTIDLRYPVIESWLLAASPGNALVGKWLAALTPLKDMGNHAYFQHMQARADYDEIKQNISTPSYLLVYLAGQVAMREYQHVNLFLKKCEDSAFLLQEYYGWNNYKMNYALCRLPNILPQLPIVKLTSGDRMLVEMLRKFHLIKTNSTMGSVLANSTR